MDSMNNPNLQPGSEKISLPGQGTGELMAPDLSTETAPASESVSPGDIGGNQGSPVVLPADVSEISPAQKPSAQAGPIGAPVSATNQDQIEPEWVEAAEKAMQSTAGNPYAEEEAIEDLQIDYLKKRYGKEIKKNPDA